MDSVLTAWVITFTIVITEILLTIKINKPKMNNYKCCTDECYFCYDKKCKDRIEKQE